jgi:hypothetical protein
VQIEAFFVQRQEESDGETTYGGEEDEAQMPTALALK